MEKNNKRLYFSLTCDVDPDIDSFSLHPKLDRSCYWEGIHKGIPLFRAFQKKYLSSYLIYLPVTWLLRSDRMIFETYGDPGFCYKYFHDIWKAEMNLHKSELGWHPHLYRWHEKFKQWRPYLFADDDLQILSHCLDEMRKHLPIESVRTGWVYHSNALMKMFSEKNIKVDASAVPGSVQNGVWSHNWAGAPRFPYFPSTSDYRAAAFSGQPFLEILEMPVLSRRLNFSQALPRFCLRLVRNRIFDWPSANWQGIIITRNPAGFKQALQQILVEAGERTELFIITYTHCSEFNSATTLRNIQLNLKTLIDLAERYSFSVNPLTLSRMGEIARRGFRLAK